MIMTTEEKALQKAWDLIKEIHIASKKITQGYNNSAASARASQRNRRAIKNNRQQIEKLGTLISKHPAILHVKNPNEENKTLFLYATEIGMAYQFIPHALQDAATLITCDTDYLNNLHTALIEASAYIAQRSTESEAEQKHAFDKTLVYTTAMAEAVSRIIQSRTTPNLPPDIWKH